MAYGKFEFNGSGIGYLWLFIWTALLTFLSFGLFFPWAVSATQRWMAANIKIDGKQLCFKGSGVGFFANWLLIFILSIITFGIYIPWGAVRLFRWVVNNTYFAGAGDVECLVDAKRIERNEYCQNCGNKLAKNASFCGQCGEKV